MRDNRNQLRKKIENYSYGLNDHLDLAHKGSTFKGLNEQTEEKVAIKVVDLRNKQPQFVKEQLNIEIQILKKLKHPNLIHCLDVYSTVNNCYIITEFCDQGDLQNRITTRGPLKEHQALIIFKDILAGFLYLAQEKYVHGNLKPSCLFIKDKVIKIGGFSNSRKIGKDSKESRREVRFNPYQSPESARDFVFNHKTDIWSLGMILYVLLHGSFPWEYANKNEFLEKVGKPYTINKELGEDVKEFLKRTLTRENRLGLEDLSNHPFVQKLSVNGFSAERYATGLVNILGNLVEPPSADRAKKENHLSIARVERQINAQINWMRFLFRIIDRILSYPEEFNVTVLKFIMVRQLAIQFKELKNSLQTGENPFNFSNWLQFLREKDRIKKYRIVLGKYQERFQKIMLNYKKYIEKISSNASLSFLNPVLNENFYVSEYNCMLAVKISLEEIKKLWVRITKQYPPKLKYERDGPFKYKAELLLLDFMITYFQLNCLWVDDFIRMDYFQKNAKLEVILDVPPADLDATHLEEFQFKLTQLAII